MNDTELVVAAVAAPQPSKSDALVLTALNKIAVVVDMLVVESSEDAEYANEILREIKSVRGTLEEEWRPRIDSAHKTHKLLCDDFNKRKKPLEALEAKVKRLITDFLAKEKRERERLEREAARLVEEQRRAAEVEAAKLLRQGRVAEAHEVRQVAEAIAAPVIALPAVKLTGSAVRTNYKPVVTDFLMLVTAVAEGKVPLEALLPNESFLKAQAKANRKNLNYPGVRVDEVQELASSAKEW